ncbi:helix-turn-helix domain-containing protein [Sphingobacterium bambusae]|uniref:Helix-turn-helix domain-containing protein n=1 Tax=Sphingobacterium bambusae TaxID=662858 RepID=A0ABW6BKG2_9SPHI|nr:helix-turn-helix transcriptional regulator [Sphingobacterium bambusae]WPL47913.1 helix-turn-helix transcriptional regulator [Sphingobacterium bambusae]
MKTYTVKISRLDYEIINRVREIREKKGISQRDLSELMNLSKSFVGKVEALGQPDKYSIRHLTLIATALKLKSLDELLPKAIPDQDIIEVVYQKVPKLNKAGVESKQLEESIVEIKAI